VVGAKGFEPSTPCSQSRCATGLRYAPTACSVLDCAAMVNRLNRFRIWRTGGRRGTRRANLHPSRFEQREDTSHGTGTEPHPVTREEYGDLCLAPPRVRFPYPPHRFHLCRGPLPPLTPPGPRRTVFERGEIIRAIPLFPFVVRGAGNAKVPTSGADTVGFRVVKPRETHTGFTAERWCGDGTA